jgi:hypothetical protein
METRTIIGIIGNDANVYDIKLGSETVEILNEALNFMELRKNEEFIILLGGGTPRIENGTIPLPVDITMADLKADYLKEEIIKRDIHNVYIRKTIDKNMGKYIWGPLRESFTLLREINKIDPVGIHIFTSFDQAFIVCWVLNFFLQFKQTDIVVHGVTFVLPLHQRVYRFFSGQIIALFQMVFVWVYYFQFIQTIRKCKKEEKQNNVLQKRTFSLG